jgi:hypothetical protein
VGSDDDISHSDLINGLHSSLVFRDRIDRCPRPKNEINPLPLGLVRKGKRESSCTYQAKVRAGNECSVYFVIGGGGQIPSS